MDTNPEGSVEVKQPTIQERMMGVLSTPEEGQVEQSPEETQEEVVEEEVQEQPRYKVKVGSDEMEVDLDELIKGYSRTSDYTKKTQSLAEQRKQVEERQTEIEQARQKAIADRDAYAEKLKNVEQILSEPPQQDLAQLKNTDPVGYAVAVAEQAEKEKQLNAVRAEKAKIEQQQLQERQENHKRYIAEETRKLHSVMPDFADDIKGTVMKKEIREYAKELGYSDQELEMASDSRAVIALYEAAQYRKMKKGGKKVAPKVLKPGVASASPNQNNAYKKQRAKLRQTGRARDAAPLFAKFI